MTPGYGSTSDAKKRRAEDKAREGEVLRLAAVGWAKDKFGEGVHEFSDAFESHIVRGEE